MYTEHGSDFNAIAIMKVRVYKCWEAVKKQSKLYYTDYAFIFLPIKIISMDAKLTLKRDKFVIEQAKKYASSHKRSLSRIIETYLKSLICQDKNNTEDDFELSPFVKSMSTGVRIPADIDYKSEYLNPLTEKYK